MMSSSFTIIILHSAPDSWPDIVWRDARDLGARVLLDVAKPMTKAWRKLRHMHFANLSNRKGWLPLKCLWDGTNSLQPADLDPTQRNYVIFQTGIKFSARSIARLKRECNACIVLYMPDNIETMHIARDKAEFDRYCRHYHVDQVYSFDHKDCEQFGCEFFDFYSMLPVKDKAERTEDGKPRVLYVGSCRSKERLDMLHALYDQLRDKAHCTFYLNGVSSEDMTREGIVYNHPLTYAEVVTLVQQHDIIVEIMNGTQAGNTLRLKEAVCYNKCLLTNNPTVTASPYYDPRYMQVFDNIDSIDLSLFAPEVDYHYQGDFSPARLLQMIVEKDKRSNKRK